MTAWRTLAHQPADVPADWRERLGSRFDQRLRRIGGWAELGLYGARACLDTAGEAVLPEGAMLCVCSLQGALSATRAGIEQQALRGLPMPFTFLQSQPSQMLAALGQHLQWRGDARFVVTRDTAALLRLLQLECGPAGLLLGCVEEGQPGVAPQSEWWRVVRME